MPNVDTVSFMKANLGLFEEFYKLTKQQFGTNSDHTLAAGDYLFVALSQSKQYSV
jgi:hypothetical protein